MVTIGPPGVRIVVDVVPPRRIVVVGVPTPWSVVEVTAVPAGDPYREGLARAQAFVERRVWYDALGVLTDLSTRFPNRPEAYQQRALLFAQIPATLPEAEEDFTRAETLTTP